MGNRNQERKWQRFYLAVGLSIVLHAGIVAASWAYLHYYQPPLTITLNSGNPNLPLKVNLVMESMQAAPSAAQPETKKAQAEIVDTTDTSEFKVVNNTIDNVKSNVVPEPKIKPKEQLLQQKQAPKEVVNKNVTGNKEKNITAGAPTESEIAGMNDSVLVTSEPRYRTPPHPPEYPAQAQRRRQQGEVIVYITVEENGRTSAVTVQRSSGFALLDNAAVKAAKKWEIMPMEINGQPRRATFSVPIKFALT